MSTEREYNSSDCQEFNDVGIIHLISSLIYLVCCTAVDMCRWYMYIYIYFIYALFCMHWTSGKQKHKPRLFVLIRGHDFVCVFHICFWYVVVALFVYPFIVSYKFYSYNFPIFSCFELVLEFFIVFAESYMLVFIKCLCRFSFENTTF